MRPSDFLSIPCVADTLVAVERRLPRRSLRSPLAVAFAINRRYVRPLGVTLTSLLLNTPGPIEAFILSADLETLPEPLLTLQARFPRLKLQLVPVDFRRLDSLLMNPELEHISRETFFRYLLPDLLPAHRRVLYLDADTLVCGSLRTLWELPLEGFYAAGVPDDFNIRQGHPNALGLDQPGEHYVNAGVLLLNLEALRRDRVADRLFRLSSERVLRFMDQDAINLVFRGRIRPLPERYNVTSDSLRRKKHRFRGHPTILHFTSRWKPWRCSFPFGAWRYQAYQRLWERFAGLEPVIRVGLLVDEFFGGAGTAYGGYGFLARYGVCGLIPNEDIQIDVILAEPGKKNRPGGDIIEGTCLYFPPTRKRAFRRWLKRANYDVYLSIEACNLRVLCKDPNPRRRVLFWIQDPRPKADWEEIATVKLFPEPSYWDEALAAAVHHWAAQGRLRFLSQAASLNAKARTLYALPEAMPITLLPNPIVPPYPRETVLAAEKRNKVVFLGRIESVKRGWLFCEIAKAMPEVDFHVLGQSSRDTARNEALIAPYRALSNLHFEGHVEGAVKARHLLEAKVLVNTSIHEALPISFLEALACGALLVSNQNPEGLTERFGVWVGQVLGDGFEAVPRFVDAIRSLLNLPEDVRRRRVAAALDEVLTVHDPERFRTHLRALIKEEAARFRHPGSAAEPPLRA